MMNTSRNGFTLLVMMITGTFLFIFVLPFINRYSAPVFADEVKRDASPLEQRVIPAALHDKELQKYMNAGEKVHAIKRLRELTGAGLKEAKDTIDQLAQKQSV